MGDTFECRTHHEVRTRSVTGPRTYTNAPSWIDAPHFALICRDQQRLTELCEVPMAVLRGSGAQHGDRTSDALRNYLIQARVMSTEYDPAPKK